MQVLLWILASVLVVLGIAGLFLPALPGAPLVFGGLFLAAWADGFQKVGWATLVLLALLTLASYAAEFFTAGLGARKAGASRLAVAGALIGLVVGFFFGVPGILIGPFAGAFLGELLARRNILQAGKAGFFAAIGLMLGLALKLAIVLAMIGLFVTAYLL